MTTFDQVLRLVQQLPLPEQARLRALLEHNEEIAHAEQIIRNQAAIAMLDSWSLEEEEDDGSESWDTMLRTLDQHRETSRKLYPDLDHNPDQLRS